MVSRADLERLLQTLAELTEPGPLSRAIGEGRAEDLRAVAEILNARRRLAEEVAGALMVNGGGEVADRLVLTKDGPHRDLGGRCRGSVIDTIEGCLGGYLVLRRNAP